MIFTENAVAEGLVKFRRGASSYRITFGRFGAHGLFHSGDLLMSVLGIDLSRVMVAFVSNAILRGIIFFFTGEAVDL